MVDKKMYRQIQNYKRKGLTKKEIASELKRDPKTVAKYYSMGEEKFKAYKQEHMFRDRIFEKYEDDILEIYSKNDYRKLYMSSVYDFLEEKYNDLLGTEKSLRNYIGYLMQINKLTLNENIRVYKKVDELPFGKQTQLDFGEYRCRSGLKLYILTALLSASRFKYVIFQDHPFKTKEVIQHMLNCYDYFGGITEELVIDQDKLMVVSENHGDIIYTNDFNYFISEQKIKMYVCRKADPETKGKVENLVKYVKTSFLNTRDFTDIDEANASLFKWLRRRANGNISQATKQIPAVVVENEREKLKPVRNSIFRKDSLIGREERTAGEKACVSVDACSYQLPVKYKDKIVEIYTTNKKLFVYDSYTGKQITEYDLSLIPGKLISKKEYRRNTESTLDELKKQVIEMYSIKNWKLFTEKNFKAFSRYVRDQCIEAKKHFTGKKIDNTILDKALEFCLENNTLSFSNLIDTNNYYHSMHEESKDAFSDEEINNTILEYSGKYEPLNINNRDLSVYKEIIKKRESINR